MTAGVQEIDQGRAAPGKARRLTSFWRVQIAGWALFSVADLAARQSLYQDFPVTLALTLAMTLALLLLTAALRHVYDRLALERSGPFCAGAWILGLSLPCAVAVVALSDALRGLFGWTIPNWDPVETWVLLVTYNLTVIAGWSLAYAWVRAEIARRGSAERAARAEAEALRAELGRLRLQLDPHFLFNALNGVATEIGDNPPTALAMVRELADYLRHSLESRDRTVVPLATEAKALAAYLAVQRARFADRLKTTLEVAPDAEARPIASFLLQPLVENAIKHGSRTPALSIAIAVRTEGEALIATVRNNGTLSPARPRAGGGVGLANLRQRLALHYPERHRFSLGEEQGLVTAELVLRGDPWSGS